MFDQIFSVERIERVLKTSSALAAAQKLLFEKSLCGLFSQFRGLKISLESFLMPVSVHYCLSLLWGELWNCFYRKPIHLECVILISSDLLNIVWCCGVFDGHWATDSNMPMLWNGWYSAVKYGRSCLMMLQLKNFVIPPLNALESLQVFELWHQLWNFIMEIPCLQNL